MYADMMDTIGFVSKYDEEVGKARNLELARQQRNIELIAVSYTHLDVYKRQHIRRSTAAAEA